MSEIIVLTKQQKLVIDPPTRTVAVVSSGPMGPPGPAGLSTICTSTTRPSTPFAGMRIFETDTKRELLYDGVGWIIMSEPWQTFASVIGSSAGSGLAGTVTFDYQRCRADVAFHARVVITNVGTGTSGAFVTFTLPTGWGTAHNHIGNARESAVSGHSAAILASVTTASIIQYGNGTTIGPAFGWDCSGRYQSTGLYS